MTNTDQLDNRIRSLVDALSDLAPPAPPFPDGRLVHIRQRRRKKRWLVGTPLALAVLGGTAAAAIPAVIQTSPGTERLFVRETTTGEQIRAYLFAGEGSVPATLQGELSTNKAIGSLTVDSVPVSRPNDFYVPIATVFGSGTEQAGAVAVRTGSNVALVSASFRGGTKDSMHPVDGWAILGTTGQRFGGKVEAFASNGHELGTVVIPPPTESGEGFPGESVDTFDRVTNQGVVIIGHIVRGADGGYWVYPYVADEEAVQLGIEGIQVCHPNSQTALDPEVAVAGVSEGQPMTVVVVFAGSAITRVAIAYANGVHDEMRTVRDEAVLVTIGTIAKSGQLETMKKATLEGFDSDGRLVARQSVIPTGVGSCLPG